jgi:hypothetical protein
MLISEIEFSYLSHAAVLLMQARGFAKEFADKMRTVE